MKQEKAFLISKKEVAPDVFHLFFYGEGEGIGFVPGQYAILSIPGSPIPLKRLYSFAGLNTDKNSFELLIKLVPGGAASEYVKTLAIGDIVDVSGPAGVFAERQTQSRKIYMVTGTGFAPIRSFLMSTDPSDHTERSLYWGLKDLSEVYLFDELLRLKQTLPLFNFTYCLSQQTTFGIIPAYLLHYFRNGHIDTVWESQNAQIEANDEYYMCGSREVVDSLRLLLLSKGASKDNLIFEKY